MSVPLPLIEKQVCTCLLKNNYEIPELFLAFLPWYETKRMQKESTDGYHAGNHKSQAALSVLLYACHSQQPVRQTC